MGLLTRMLNPQAVVPGPGADFWYESAATLTTAGMRVTPEIANNFSAVYACRKVLCEDIAQLPLITYRTRPDGGRDRDKKNPLYPLLHDQPNRWMTAYEFKEMIVDHILFRGNFYARVRRSPGWLAGELVPLHPDRVTPEMLADGSVRYRVRNKDGIEETPLLQSQVLHIPGLGFDGLRGVSVIAYARQSIGGALQAQEQAHRMFHQGTQLSGVLEHPNELTKRSANRIAKSWRETHSGAANTGKVAVLEEGMTFKPISMTAEDAQFLESRQFEVTEMARWFRVQPHLIMDLTRSTNNNIEHQGIEHVVYSLSPWTVKIQQRIQMTLVTDDDVYVEFLLDALLRGDTATRYQAYGVGIDKGFLSRNEVRSRENLNPDPALDRFLVPMNMSVIGERDMAKATEAVGALVRAGYDPDDAREVIGLPPMEHLGLPPVTVQSAKGTGAIEPGSAESRSSKATAEMYAREAAARVVRKENATLSKAAVRFADDGEGWTLAVADFYEEHAAFVAKVMVVPDALALAYTDTQMAAVLSSGVGILEQTEEQRIDELAALAVGETA
jgi:HK97 family phage portal protein